jgi:DNA recombination protein RmuC
MREGQEQVRAEAARLGNSLRNAPKARGRWGEQQLRNVLEQCGLSEHTDFITERSIPRKAACAPTPSCAFPATSCW